MNDGKVEINTDTVALASTKRVKKMLTRDLECTLLYLIVGGGSSQVFHVFSVLHLVTKSCHGFDNS